MSSNKRPGDCNQYTLKTKRMPDPLAVGEAVLDRLMRHNEDRKAQGAALQQEIRQIIDAEPKLSASEVRAKLTKPRALRTVQLHLQMIRAVRRSCADD